MNEKTILYFLYLSLVAIFAIGLLAGLRVEKTDKQIGATQQIEKEVVSEVHKNTETINHLAVSLSQFQGNFQHLERELAKKMGIAVSVNEQKIPTPDEALLKAESLVKQGNLTKAGLYFSYSLSQNPGQWEKIHRYQQSVLNYCYWLRDNGNYEIVLNVLAEMEAFLRTQATSLTMPNIEKLYQTLTEVAEFRKETADMMAAISLFKTRQLMKTLLANELGSPSTVFDEWGTPFTKETQQLTEHINKLKTNLVALQTLNTNLLNETESNEIADKVKLTEKNIATFEKQLSTVQSAKMVSTLVQRAEQFIDNAKNEAPQSELILYYLTSAESIIRQLTLLTPEIEIATTQMAKLSQKLESAKHLIARNQSQIVFKEIEQKFNNLNFISETKAQEAIEKLLQFKQWLSQQAGRLPSVEFLDKMQLLMETTHKKIVEWQEQQHHRYEQWAIQNIVNFYNSHQDELGVGTDENRLYSGIIKHLGNIDTRYLSTSSSTAYNEVFNIFYMELSNDLKIPLSSEMTLTKNKSLSDF
ncbi:hypothetical protein [Candidatus Parabeggiatoa sp. HSG14]|uniref:hypothetical protein n=1 Tax=Candidatus Parabeggiatoa sp. HSG14 TaxID=3055593 RepID=UPI0025A8F0FB|nr:hypothetical protein [Thiotrichales bacterium HSG14]